MRRRLLPLALLLGLAVAPLPQQQAGASCAAPYLSDAPRQAQRGDRVTAEGRAYADGCQDSQSCSSTLGCSSCESDDPPPLPMRQVELWMSQGRNSWLLDVSDAGSAEDGELGKVIWTFKVPDDAKPGRAILRPDRSDPVWIRIT